MGLGPARVMAGTYKGLDTVFVVKAAPSSGVFQRFEVLEVICKPRHLKVGSPPRYEGWAGDLDKYYEPIFQLSWPTNAAVTGAISGAAR